MYIFHFTILTILYYTQYTDVGSDNTQYDGEWRANMRQGIGTALYEDGRYVLVVIVSTTIITIISLLLVVW